MSLEAYINQEQDEYIPVLDFINALYKHASPQVPLKNILEYLGNNYSFHDLELYRKDGYSHTLVRSTGLLEHESSTEVIRSIYNGLDQEQIGISYSGIESFKSFYFRLSDASKYYEYVGTNPPELQTTNATVLKPSDNTISFLGKYQGAISPNEYQRITMLYDYFTPHEAACFIAGLHPDFNGANDGLEMGLGVISGGIKSGRLPIDDDGQLNSDDLKIFLHSKDWVMIGFNDKSLSSTDPMAKIREELIEAKSKIIDLTAKLEQAELDSIILNSSGVPKQIEQLAVENKRLKDQQNKQATDAQSKIKALESELKKANEALADKPTDSVTYSNTDIYNAKQAAIKQFNRSLAMALIELDYQRKLRKQDIVNFIIPYMKELAFILADENGERANSLIVSYDTLYDTHLQGLNFKKGNQSNKDKEKQTIELLFEKQLPVTE